MCPPSLRGGLCGAAQCAGWRRGSGPANPANPENLDFWRARKKALARISPNLQKSLRGLRGLRALRAFFKSFSGFSFGDLRGLRTSEDSEFQGCPATARGKNLDPPPYELLLKGVAVPGWVGGIDRINSGRSRLGDDTE